MKSRRLQNRLLSRRLAFETLDNRLLLTGEIAAVGPEPDLVVPAEIAAEEAQLEGSSEVLEGGGPRVRPGAEATRTVTDSGFIIEVRLNIPPDAVAPDLDVAPSDPTGDTAAPT